ncbi:MAG TPA: hypothetical protein VHY48_11620 [Acidobacteriaceae bacterium]|jgi:hypothetical protein|nr:hypothetical protein [Acidobacteriaceae bacterium]
MNSMTKRRGYPDRRGMGAKSDFISESFAPSTQYSAEQIVRAKSLIATGFPAERVAAMLSLSIDDLQKILTQPEISSSN